MRWGGLGHRTATSHNFPEGLSLATVGGRPRAFRVSLFLLSSFFRAREGVPSGFVIRLGRPSRASAPGPHC